jgi:hypothetical protein
VAVSVVAVSLTAGIENAWANVAEFVPKLGAALAVLMVGWLFARAVRGGFERLARKLRFDEAVDRAGLGRWSERLGYADSGVLVARILYWAVMLVVLQLAIDVFGDSRVQEALASVVAFLPRLAIALVLLVVTGAIAGRVRELTAAALSTASYGRGVATAAGVAVWSVGTFAALDQLGVAPVIVTTLFQAAVYTVALILVIKFGIGGVASARDRFWPKVYDKVQGPLPPRPVYAPRPLPPGYGPGWAPYPGGAYAPGAVPPGYAVPVPHGYVVPPGSAGSPPAGAVGVGSPVAGAQPTAAQAAVATPATAAHPYPTGAAAPQVAAAYPAPPPAPAMSPANASSAAAAPGTGAADIDLT